MTSSSVIASRRCQSVAPLGRGSPAFTVTRIIPVLLMSCSFPRRNNVTNVFASHRHRHEQDAPLGHAYYLNSLFPIRESHIDILQSVRIFEGGDSIHEID